MRVYAVVGDVELFARYRPKASAKVIAITGANGKTTVTTLVGEMCQGCRLENHRCRQYWFASARCC